MLGAIIGDIVGSVYEFDNIKTKDFPLFREDSRITDDTVCTVAVADIILNDKDPVETMVYWCRKYTGMGYGDRFVKWFDLPWQEPYNSFGNGAAMRVSPAAFLSATLEQSRWHARKVTEMTHNHPEGIKGALAVSDAVWMALNSAQPNEIRAHIGATYGYNMDRTVDSIRPDYEFNESCMKTVPEAIICALEARDFEDAIRNAVSLGGDSDTLAAITGALAEALFTVPEELCREAMDRLPQDMRTVITQAYAQSGRDSAEPKLSSVVVKQVDKPYDPNELPGWYKDYVVKIANDGIYRATEANAGPVWGHCDSGKMSAIEKFLSDELFSMTLAATVQRASIYIKGALEEDKSAFRSSLQIALERMIPQYREGPVPDSVHYKNIELLAACLSAEHGAILDNGRFRIGSAQKAVNLYLKYMWCLGRVPMPPHCPIDAVVLAHVPGCRGVKWTKLDSIIEYADVIRKVRDVAGNFPLAEWELALYNAAGTGSKPEAAE